MRNFLFCIFLLLTPFCSQAQWNPNTSVNLEVATVPVADMQSLTTSTGKTWVAFYHNNSGNYDMRAQLLDVDGTKLLGPDGMLVDNKPSGSATYVFSICKDANDNLVVAYQDQRSGNLSAVAYKISQNGTHLWSANGVVLGEGLAPYPAALSNGETAIAWNEAVSNTLNIQKISATGSTVWSSPISVQIGTSKTTRGQIISNLNGRFTMVFQRRGFGISTTLFAQRYNTDGTGAWTNPIQLSTETTSGARYYSIAAEADTTYFGYYSSAGSRFNSWLQRINPDGTTPYGANGANFSTATGGSDPYQQMTNIALDPGSAFVWSLCSFSNTSQSQYGVYVQKFLKSSGARLLGDGALNIYPISTSFDTQAGNVSLINDAPVFMSYDANYKIYATRLNGSGGFVWTPNRIELSSTTAGGSTPKGRFGFSALSNTQAVAIWTETRSGVEKAYAQNITPGGLFRLIVSTQGSVPATISTSGGTLQMVATVSPSSASQSVTWSIVPGTGTATISSGGLVTATGNGTVWAKAISVQDNTVRDSLQLTLSGQGPTVPVTSLTVTTQGNLAANINTNGGTLQMVATISPANATNQNVTWSIVPGTGTATINSSGLVTALTNGTVHAKAVSVANSNAKDSVQITITNQVVAVTGLTVTTQGNVAANINTNGGTLQMVATIAPANATNQSVTWSIVPGTGTASISSSGLVTALTNGTVHAKAVSVANSNAKDSVQITITNQVVAVTGLTVATQGNIAANINTNGGILQMVATIAPANATNQNVTWSIVPGTGTASINSSGLVTALTNGTVHAKAVSVTNSNAKDSVQITITNQVVAVTGLTVTTQGNVAANINTNGGTTQMVATISPANATNQNVTWSIVPGTGTATINSSGLVTALTNGTVHAKAVSVANSNAKDSMLITIKNQVTTAVINPVFQSLRIYPNPAADFLTISLGRNHPAFELEIVGASGQLIARMPIAANRLRNPLTILLTGWSKGIYVLRINDHAGFTMHRFLIF